MDQTDCLGLPYPECDPPLTKDASDIEQFRDLAEAVDSAVQDYADAIQNLLTAPDAVYMTGGDNTAGQDVTHSLQTVIFDNASMGDTAADVIRIQETGWYMLGGHVTVSTATAIFMRVEPLVNGEMVSSLQGPGFSTGANEDTAWADTLFLQAGDAVTIHTHHAALAATVYSYTVHAWALRILVNV